MSRLFRHVGPKICFTVSVVSILLLEAGLITAPSIILYFHSFTFLPLFAYRIVTYWSKKQQLFLLDHCYVVNLITLLVIWAAPDSPKLLQLQFGMSHGPLLWAPLIYRNSLVPDDIDRITSSYIHVLPPLIAFVIRWLPEQTSVGWYKPFARLITNESSIFNHVSIVNYSPDMWPLVLCAPIAIFVLHVACYMTLVHVIIRPSEEYVDSYSYMLSRDDFIGTILRNASGRRRLIIAISSFVMVGTAQYCVTPILYCFLLTDIVAIAIQELLIVWNGATYHVDVYRRALGELERIRMTDNSLINPNERNKSEGVVSTSYEMKAAVGDNSNGDIS